MNFLQLIWSHELEEEPIFFYFEIGNDGYANKQIEVFSDFSYCLYSQEVSIGQGFLTPMKFDLEELFSQNDEEISHFEISGELFNHLWQYFLNKYQTPKDI